MPKSTSTTALASLWPIATDTASCNSFSECFGHTMGNISVWYDEEGDYLELTREDDEGFFVDLGDGVFERVSEDGETLGFAVLNVSARKQRNLPFEVTFEKKPGDA